jgi:hypothetical protein
MNWRKLGRLYVPRGAHPKLATHAANPVAVPLEGSLYRVYYSGRDASKRSSVGAVDIDLDARRVEREHAAPVFTHGSGGVFYAEGVSVGTWYEAAGVRRIGFMGWRIPPGEHWRGEIGMLRVDASGLALELDDERPVLGIGTADRVSLSYPCVVPAAGGGFDMWYGSTIAWDAGNGEMLHVIRHARSTDGRNWVRDDRALPHRIGTAQAFSRPAVVHDPDRGWHMWFSYRGGGGERYRIGHARSDDGLAWELELRQAALEPSVDGWDAGMVEYPFVLRHRGLTYMLYNGSDYGASGFGLAVLD